MSTNARLRNFGHSTLFQTYPNRNKRYLTQLGCPNSLLCQSSSLCYCPGRLKSCPNSNNCKNYNKNRRHYYICIFLEKKNSYMYKKMQKKDFLYIFLCVLLPLPLPLPPKGERGFPFRGGNQTKI